MTQSQIPDTLFNDFAMLQEIVESLNITGKSIDFFTDSGGFTIEKGRIICTMLDYGSTILEITLLNKNLTFQLKNSTTVGTTQTASAESLDLLAQYIRDAADEIHTLALNRYEAIYSSHWNTSDGRTGNQSVSESLSRQTAHISTPSGGEGVPFETGGWANTNQESSDDTSVTFTTPGEVTGFGGDSTMEITVYSADGTTVLDTYTTPAITANTTFTSPSGKILVAIKFFGQDAPSCYETKYKANVSISIDLEGIFNDNSLNGGRGHVEIIHTTDTTTDGAQTFSYIQNDVFLDYGNPPAPLVSGSVSIEETPGTVFTKHLSGIEYYIQGSQFTATVSDIDNLNNNTQKYPGNLKLEATGYNLETLEHSPAGSGSSHFYNWTNDHDAQDIEYSNPVWCVSCSCNRFVSVTAKLTATPMDPWVNGTSVNSINHSVLIDTCSSSSTSLFEEFSSEGWREDPASFPGVGSWDSSSTLIAGEAIIFDSQMMPPNQTYFIEVTGPGAINTNWSTFKPDLGGPNPDYTALGVPVSFGRRFTQTSLNPISSFSMQFTGTFAGGDAFTDMTNGDLEVYIYRIAGAGFVGPPPGNTTPLRAHLPFILASWDDGLTVPGSGIQEGSSTGNTINCTFGPGTPAQTGFYCEIIILDPTIKISSVTVTLL